MRRRFLPAPAVVQFLLFFMGASFGVLRGHAQTAFYRLNAGGMATTTSLGTFAADNSPPYYTGGGTETIATPIAGTDASLQTLYQSVRFGDFSYALPVATGYYRVVLHFAELRATGPGQRVFDVQAENIQVLANYDIYRKVGANTATTEAFQLLVTDGSLDLTFTKHPNSSWGQVCAIEVLPPLALSPSTQPVDATHLALWGDSFTDHNYGRFPQSLATLADLTVYNGGVGGETSTQVKDRMLLASNDDKREWPTIFWVGRNNSDQPEVVVQDLKAMIAHLTHTNYLVLSVCNARTEPAGSYGYHVQLALNSQLASAFGAHYSDIRSFFVSSYDGSLAQDRADYANDVPPSTLVGPDQLHPTTYGSDLFATYAYAHLGQLLGTPAGAAGPTGQALSVYPNPLVSQATVAFTVPDAQDFVLVMYDTKGSLVKQLAAGTAQPARRYTYILGRQDVQPGLYVVCLQTGSRWLSSRVMVE